MQLSHIDLDLASHRRVSGACFQLSSSNATHVRLQETTLQYTGRYMCEISTEAPTFSSIQGKGEVHVVGECRPGFESAC